MGELGVDWDGPVMWIWGALGVDWSVFLGWIGGGLGWIGVDWGGLVLALVSLHYRNRHIFAF